MAQDLRIVPTIWMMRNPFKIHEFREVLKGASVGSDHSILDLGCGSGFQTQVLARRCRHALGLDVAPGQIERAKQFLRNSCVEERVEFLCSRLEEAGLPAASFDRVFSFCVLEHIPNLSVVLRELVRLLKPGGEMHLSVDALSSIRDSALLERHRREHSVVQYFTPATLRTELESAGLQVTEIFPIMKGEFARKAFERRIQSRGFSHGLIGRLRFSRRLREDDERTGGAEGIMLVARARRNQEPMSLESADR